MPLPDTPPPQRRFAVAAIPLSRPDVTAFLQRRAVPPAGARVLVLAQRPTAAAEGAWLRRLGAARAPDAADLVAIDDPHGHLVEVHSDRLVPVESLEDPGFLTRSLGGWAPVYLEVVALPEDGEADPVLRHLHVLAAHGPAIRFIGADPAQVAARLQAETGLDAPGVARAFAALRRLGATSPDAPAERIRMLYRLLEPDADGGRATVDGGLPEIPELLVLDELLGRMIALELARRAAVAEGDGGGAAALGEDLAALGEQGLRLILKNEYIAGRHRRSAVLLAPRLGVVVKQPAPEPLHEIVLAAQEVDGRPENWPRAVDGGHLVTARGRLRLLLTENLVPRLDGVFGRLVRFSSLLGIVVEPFTRGPTLQADVLADPARMTAERYEEIVLHQQVCEALGGDNGDWHSANFLVREGDGALVHVDWGAARPLTAAERAGKGTRERLNQVRNLAFSFHDEALADLVRRRHDDLLADPARLERLRREAARLAAAAG